MITRLARDDMMDAFYGQTVQVKKLKVVMIYITSSCITFNGEGGVEAGWCLLLAVVVMVGRRKYGVIAALLVRKYR